MALAATKPMQPLPTPARIGLCSRWPIKASKQTMAIAPAKTNAFGEEVACLRIISDHSFIFALTVVIKVFAPYRLRYAGVSTRQARCGQPGGPSTDFRGHDAPRKCW